MEAKNRTLVIIVIAVVAILAAVFFWFALKPINESKQVEVPGLQENIFKQQQEINKWKDAAEASRDSLQMVSTEKAIVEIELNKSEAKIRQYIKQIEAFKNYPKVGSPTIWTEEIDNKILNCDSLTNQLRDEYFNHVEARQELADSLNLFYEAIIEAKDSTIADQERWGARILSDLTTAQYKNAEKQDRLDKANKKKHVGWVAAAVGATLAALVSLF